MYVFLEILNNLALMSVAFSVGFLIRQLENKFYRWLFLGIVCFLLIIRSIYS